jgi:hypothetical protein
MVKTGFFDYGLGMKDGEAKIEQYLESGQKNINGWLFGTLFRCGALPAAKIQAKDAFQLADGLRKSKGTVRTGHDRLRLGARKVRTPIGYDTVRTVLRISPATIANDAVVRR